MPLRWLAAYGLTISFLQFGLLFLALHLGMPAGMASLILQTQAFFTLLFGALLLGEKLHVSNIVGLIVAVAGMILLARTSVSAHTGQNMTLLTLILTLSAALCWGIGNITNKVIMRRYPVEAMRLVVWSAFVPVVPFFACSLLFDGAPAIMTSLKNFTWHEALTLFYLAIICTVIGFGIWGTLLSKYPTAKVAPMTLLVPVAGMFSAAVILDEQVSRLQAVAIAVIVAGLVINSFSVRVYGWYKKKAHTG
ncbi:MAG: putative amino-acid metabolite efflux pump [Candidatus Erwinia impunctatus]